MPCAPGDAVELRLEPTNPYDENAVAMDVVVLDTNRYDRAISMLDPALVRERGNDGEDDGVYFRDSTAPQMLIALLMTTPVSITAARLGAPQESNLANSR